MADIKSYLKEKEKREKSKEQYRVKIKRHKLTTVYRVLLVLLVVVALIVMAIIQYKRHIYTDYDIVESLEREKSPDAKDIRLENTILTFSKDGAHCTDTKGNIVWNQTYEIQDIKMDICQDAVAIGNYNGRSIYVQNTKKLLGEINTNMPIKNLAVSGTGTVTAILEDTDLTWINTYSPEGKELYTGQARMSDSGYPCAIGLSPNGELLAVSYLKIDGGALKTNIAFYNFGPVGANQSDYLVSTYFYPDIVPEVHFMDNNTAFAVGDSRLMVFKGGQKPVSEVEHLFNREIQAVYYSDKYIGLVFLSDKADSYYELVIYDSMGKQIHQCYFSMDYRDIFFGQDNFVIYNESECMVTTMDGICKYHDYFTKVVNLMLPGSTPYRYVLVTDHSIDTIQLK